MAAAWAPGLVIVVPAAPPDEIRVQASDILDPAAGRSKVLIQQSRVGIVLVHPPRHDHAGVERLLALASECVLVRLLRPAEIGCVQRPVRVHRLAEAKCHGRAGSWCSRGFDPAGPPVGLIQQAHGPRGRRTPRGRASIAVPNADFPAHMGPGLHSPSGVNHVQGTSSWTYFRPHSRFGKDARTSNRSPRPNSPD